MLKKKKKNQPQRAIQDCLNGENSHCIPGCHLEQKKKISSAGRSGCSTENVQNSTDNIDVPRMVTILSFRINISTHRETY